MKGNRPGTAAGPQMPLTAARGKTAGVLLVAEPGLTPGMAACEPAWAVALCHWQQHSRSCVHWGAGRQHLSHCVAVYRAGQQGQKDLK